MGMFIFLAFCAAILFADIKVNNPEVFDNIEE